MDAINLQETGTCEYHSQNPGKMHGCGHDGLLERFPIDEIYELHNAPFLPALQTVVSRNSNPLDPAVISCTELHTDGAHNAVPSTVIITGDTRSTSPQTQKLIEKRMREICVGCCEMNNAE